MINVFFHDKYFFGEDADHSFNREVNICRRLGYGVVIDSSIAPLSPRFDVVIAHPQYRAISRLRDFHQQHPQKAMVIWTGDYGDFTRIPSNLRNGFYKDAEGIYVPWNRGEMPEFETFIQDLSAQILKFRS